MTKAVFKYWREELCESDSYRKHDGQTVEVLGPVDNDSEEIRAAYGECLVLIRAADGWTGEAFETELTAVSE